MAQRSRRKAPAAPPVSEHEEVARRAYQRFEKRGWVHGYDVEDWMEAEREVREERAARSDSKVRMLKPRAARPRTKTRAKKTEDSPT